MHRSTRRHQGGAKMTSVISEIKARLTLERVMSDCGYGDRCKQSARCPFHLDEHPSFGVFERECQQYRKCQTGCGHGDLIDFYMKAKSVSQAQAITELGHMAGIPSTSSPKQAGTPERIVRQLSLVQMLPIVFIDKPLFQANAFHLLVGKKNAGKGTFLSSVAARFTRGELGVNRKVIWIAAGEDSLSLDVRPRIEAAGGDTTQVYYPNVVPRLPLDVPLLRQWITETGNVGLVVLDPISGMLRYSVNTNMDNDVRCAISPLNELADTEKCLIIGVRHLKKDASQGALDSILGTADWANVPRAVLAMAMDDEDEDIRHVQVVAGNRMPRGSASRSFRIVGVNMVEGGEPVAKAEFINGPGKSVDEMLQADPTMCNSKTKLAKLCMLDKLEQVTGSIESDKLTAEIASEHQIAIKTVRNAKTWLKDNGLIAFSPDKDETGKILQWNVRRTNAPRPPELQPPRPAGAESLLASCPDAADEKPHPVPSPDTKYTGCGKDVGNIRDVAGEPDPVHIPCFDTQEIGRDVASSALCSGMTNPDCLCKSCEDFRQSKWVYPSNEPEWAKLFPNETYPHWQAARKEAVAKPCAICGEQMGNDPYLWLNIKSPAAQCCVCRETHWWADGHEIDEDGFPSCWNHEHRREERIAERTRNELQRAARYRAKALGQDYKAAWETLLAEEGEETRHLVEIANRYDRQGREQRSADYVTI